MYAVIKTGGKQYRVKPGDVLVVEKLAGDAGAEVSFDQVLMLGGEGGEISVGAPLVDGASVTATLVETRKGEKIKVFKKRRRQGYRRTQGHRQAETVLRVTAIAGAGANEKWDGTVDLTTRAVLNARARNLTSLVAELEGKPAAAKVKAAPAPKAKAAPKPAPAQAEAAPAPALTEEQPKPAAKAKAATPATAPKKAPTKQDSKPKMSATAAPKAPAPKTARPKGKG